MKKSEIMRYKVEIMTYPVNYPVEQTTVEMIKILNWKWDIKLKW